MQFTLLYIEPSIPLKKAFIEDCVYAGFDVLPSSPPLVLRHAFLFRPDFILVGESVKRDRLSNMKFRMDQVGYRRVADKRGPGPVQCAVWLYCPTAQSAALKLFDMYCTEK